MKLQILLAVVITAIVTVGVVYSVMARQMAGLLDARDQLVEAQQAVMTVPDSLLANLVPRAQAIQSRAEQIQVCRDLLGLEDG